MESGLNGVGSDEEKQQHRKEELVERQDTEEMLNSPFVGTMTVVGLGQDSNLDAMSLSNLSQFKDNVANDMESSAIDSGLLRDQDAVGNEGGDDQVLTLRRDRTLTQVWNAGAEENRSVRSVLKDN